MGNEDREKEKSCCPFGIKEVCVVRWDSNTSLVQALADKFQFQKIK